MDSLLSGIAFIASAALIISSSKDKINTRKLTSYGCPFGFRDTKYTSQTSISSSLSSKLIPTITPVPTSNEGIFKVKHPKDLLNDFIARNGRVIGLYEIYVHLPMLKQIWDSASACEIEPYFISAFHGIELGFLLLAEFIKDSRYYLVKRSRIEQVCRDIVSQVYIIVTNSIIPLFTAAHY